VCVCVSNGRVGERGGLAAGQMDRRRLAHFRTRFLYSIRLRVLKSRKKENCASKFRIHELESDFYNVVCTLMQRAAIIYEWHLELEILSFTKVIQNPHFV
jgi:hypothetical protein